jgi:hypothetical protein
VKIDAEKTAFNARAKAGMEKYLRSKSWVEKVESIERMNISSRIARAAMKKTLAEEDSVNHGASPCE